MELRCPICALPLYRQERTWRCQSGHSFDIARQGHVNLLPVQHKHSLSPGDSAAQVVGRRAFLEGGFYAPLARSICELAEEQGLQGPILDVGCGEGYYSAQLAQTLDCELVGVDISKEAVRFAAGKYKNALWLCASAARLPVAEHSVGLLTSLFALTLPEEFRRVLRPDGAFLQVLAAPDHLLGLRSIIYPQIREKEEKQPEAPEGFQLVCSRPVRFSFTAEGAQVQNLLEMTPHAHRIGPEGAQRLRQTQCLMDTASCVVNLYRPAE